MLDPTPRLPDETLLTQIKMPTRIRNALHRAGLESVGAVRAAQDRDLRRRRYIGPLSLAYLRKVLGARHANSAETTREHSAPENVSDSAASLGGASNPHMPH